VQRVVDATIAKLDQLQQCADTLALPRHLPRTQAVTRCIRMCIPSRVNFLLRTVAPELTTAAALRLDAAVHRAVLRLLGHGNDAELMDASTLAGRAFRLRLFLPLSEGGFGITSSARAVDAAYVGSLAAIGGHIRTVVTVDARDPPPPPPPAAGGVGAGAGADGPANAAAVAGEETAAVAAGNGPDSPPAAITYGHAVFAPLKAALVRLTKARAAHGNCDAGKAPPPFPPSVEATLTVKPTAAPQQHDIDAMLAAFAAADLYQMLEADPDGRAQLLSCAGEHAGAWVTASPAVACNRIEDGDFKIAAALRLRLPLPAPHGPVPAAPCVHCTTNPLSTVTTRSAATAPKAPSTGGTRG
jgi:hypothetical protein